MSSQFLAFPASNPQTRIPSIMCRPTYSWKRPAHWHPGYWFVVDITKSWWQDDHCVMCTAPTQTIQASASSKPSQPANLSYLSHIANRPVSESRKCHRSIYPGNLHRSPCKISHCCHYGFSALRLVQILVYLPATHCQLSSQYKKQLSSGKDNTINCYYWAMGIQQRHLI